MKSTINNHIISSKSDIGNIHFGGQQNPNEIKIVDYQEQHENGQLIISLYSHIFSGNELNLFIRGNKIILIIEESIDYSNSDLEFINDWQSYLPHKHTRMRNISLLLPGDNFYILRHFIMPEEYLLKIFLGRLLDN